MVKYVLTGVTGDLGSRTFRNLIKLVPPSDIIVSLYNASGAPDEVKRSGAEIRHGDYSKPATLDTAFAGGDKLLLVSHPSFTDEFRVGLHKAAIDAAKRVGIKHVYYTSLGFTGDTKAALMQGHINTEKYLKESGLTYTIIREGIYSEGYWYWFGYWRPGTPGTDVKIPHGDGGVSWACKDDLGEATAKLLVADTHKNEIARLTGTRVVTLTEIAQLVSTYLKLDPPLKLKEVSNEEFIKSHPERSEELLHKWVTTFPALARGDVAVVDPLLRELLGREPEPFEETLKKELGVSN